MNFIDKKVSIKQAITTLAKNEIEVDDNEATVILDFLYLMSKNYNKPEEEKKAETLKRNRTSEKNTIKMP